LKGVKTSSGTIKKPQKPDTDRFRFQWKTGDDSPADF